MHLERAVPDSNAFVAVKWHLCSVLSAMHCNLNLGAVRVFLRADFHVAAVNEDVVGLELSKRSWIRLVTREDDRSTINNYQVHHRWVNVHEQVETCGYLNALVLLRLQRVAPG